MITLLTRVFLRQPFTQKTRFRKMNIQQLEKDENLAEQIKEFGQKYKLPLITAQELFVRKPSIIQQDSAENVEFNKRIVALEKLKKDPEGRVLSEIMNESKHILFDMNENDYKECLAELKKFGIENKKTELILHPCSNLVHRNMMLILKNRMNLFQDYLGLTRQQTLNIWCEQPFLLKCSELRLRESIIFFLGQKRNGVTRDQIIALLSLLGEIFLLGKQQLTLMTSWYAKWGVPEKQLWTILMANPLLLLNYPTEVLNLKVKMFKIFKFTKQMGTLMLRKWPQILIASVRSIQSKLVFFRDRLKIPINEKTLELLSLRYAQIIRPRGQMLVRTRYAVTEDNVIQLFKCKQQEFLSRLNIPEDKWKEEKERFNPTLQLDLMKRRCLAGYDNKAKVSELWKKYYSD